MNLISLLSKTDASQTAAPEILQIPVAEIHPNPSQPRKSFSAAELVSLAKSISQLGIIEPLVVRHDTVGYELICGERRLKAAKLAGLSRVPCIVCDISDLNAALFSLIENLQRQDLNFFEQAEGFRLLIEKFGLTQQEAALSLGISQPAVANKLRLLRLSERHRQIISDNNLSERHARALLRVGEEKRDEVLKVAIDRQFTAELLDRYIDAMHKKDKIKESYTKRSAAVGDVRLFMNTVEKALNVMRLAGVDAQAEKKQEDGYTLYVIKIAEKK